MTTIIGLSGSLRRTSYNSALLRTAAELAPAGCSIEIASIREIPLYDGDLETEQGIVDQTVSLEYPRTRCPHCGSLSRIIPEKSLSKNHIC